MYIFACASRKGQNNQRIDGGCILVEVEVARILSGHGANSERDIFTRDYLYQKGTSFYML